MKNYFLPFFFLCSLPGFSQSITGKVQESDGQYLAFANVLLLNSKDSTLVKGAVSDQSGAYRLDNVRSGTYLLAATMVGYQKVYSSPVAVTERGDAVNMPILVLPPDIKQLKEVSVLTTRPFVEQHLDRTVVNVANSIIASGSTALEVLEKAPGITIDRQNDGIALRGKDGVIVMIDGKQTYLAMADVVALLRSTPSDNIDKIELITNPSAKYDAAGNSGIINIRMKKDKTMGTNGSVSVAGGSGRYDRERGSLQLNHRGNGYAVFGSYSVNRGGNYWDFDLSRNQADGNLRNLIEQQSYIRFLDRGHNTKVGADFFLSKNTTVGLVWTGFWSSVEEKAPASTVFRREEGGPPYMHAETEKRLHRQSSNQLGNFNIQHTFGKKGGLLTADVDYGLFNREFDNSLHTVMLIAEDPSLGPEGLYTQMPTSIDFLTFKLDYSRSLFGNWQMEAGLKSSSVDSDNNMTLSSGPAGELQIDPELSNHFQYKERVNALFTSFSGQLWRKIQVQVGLRAEHTYSNGKSINLGGEVERNYLNLFPSLFVSRSIAKNHNLTFSYSYRIDRPNYQNLNPARGYLDPYAFSRGNPFLKPQFTHAMELKYGFKNMFFASFGADHVSDFVFFLVQPVDNQKSERTPENIGTLKAYNLNISFPTTISRNWTLQTSLQGKYSQLRYLYQGVPLEVNQISGRLNGTNSIILGKGWTAELTGWMNTPALDAIFYFQWMGSVDAGVQKAFRTNWKAKLSIQDIFHTNKYIGYGKVSDFTQNFRIGFDTRVAMLNLMYSFGNQQLKSMRLRKTGSEEEMRRTN
jgi:hypothetical protein